MYCKYIHIYVCTVSEAKFYANNHDRNKDGHRRSSQNDDSGEVLMYIYTYIYIYMYLYVCIHTHICMYCKYIHIYVCTVSTYTYMYVL
jgi:hypothetical protein